jgi:hypothetical protein
LTTKKPCEQCNWQTQYEMQLYDLKSLLSSFPPKHGDYGLIYDKHEIEEWLAKARRLIK